MQEQVTDLPLHLRFCQLYFFLNTLVMRSHWLTSFSNTHILSSPSLPPSHSLKPHGSTDWHLWATSCQGLNPVLFGSIIDQINTQWTAWNLWPSFLDKSGHISSINTTALDFWTIQISSLWINYFKMPKIVSMRIWHLDSVTTCA